MSPGSIRAEKDPLVLGAIHRVCWPSRALGSPGTTWLWDWASFCRTESGLASFLSRVRGACLPEHAGVVSRASHAGTRRYNQSSAALVLGSLALDIGSLAVLESRIGFLPVVAG